MCTLAQVKERERERGREIKERKKETEITNKNLEYIATNFNIGQ